MTRARGLCMQTNGEQSPAAPVPPPPVLPRIVEKAAIEPLRTGQ